MGSGDLNSRLESAQPFWPLSCPKGAPKGPLLTPSVPQCIVLELQVGVGVLTEGFLDLNIL